MQTPLVIYIIFFTRNSLGYTAIAVQTLSSSEQTNKYHTIAKMAPATYSNGWFHLCGLSRVVRDTKQAKLQNEKFSPTLGFEPSIFYLDGSDSPPLSKYKLNNETMTHITNILFYLGYIHLSFKAVRWHSHAWSLGNVFYIRKQQGGNNWRFAHQSLKFPVPWHTRVHSTSYPEGTTRIAVNQLTLIYRSGQTVWSVVTPKEGSYRIPT